MSEKLTDEELDAMYKSAQTAVRYPCDHLQFRMDDVEVLRALAELRELRAIKGRPPQTADGVLIDLFANAPQPTVWIENDAKGGVLEECVVLGWVCGAWENPDNFIVAFPRDGGGWQDEEFVYTSDCYSTRAAAEAAAKEA